MSEWIYFIHPPREHFVDTITEDEATIMQIHAEHLAELHQQGVLILAGPTFGAVNTGVAIIEAADEEAARELMMSDPAVTSGLMTPELRPMRVSFLRGVDD
ncbi:YciI family protein [Methylocystis sp.]|uniref:YciI family protein n=1 Tax=Methylocystis sp. TaxID=1911079 RepID=UPI003DA3DAC7